jgi:hypothetical protein
MAIARAITNGSGERLFGGIDIHNLRADAQHGKNLDPWELISDKHTSGCKFGDIISGWIIPKTEDRAGVSASPYSILVGFIQRESNPDLRHSVRYCRSGGARFISINSTDYLVYAGKIYTRES